MSPEGLGEGEVPFDLQKVMEQVHFAFRPQGSVWEGGHSTYAVRVEAGGFSVTPFHYPRAQSASARAARRTLEQLEPTRPEYVEGEPVRFGAASVSRGGRVVASSVGAGRVEETGSLTLTRGAVAEHFRNSEAGVEQSWGFARRLEGAGALEVRVPVESGRYLGETDAGLHFAAGPTGLGVRYSHGTWVDAEGRRTPVPARFESGAIVLRVPAQVVESSAYPAVLDPTVSPEFGMDNPVSVPAEGAQYAPKVAYNGTNFLVVWVDQRSNPSGFGGHVYGARVSPTGVVLDPNSISISTVASSNMYASVAAGGTNFLVVWADSRNGSHDIYGARVSSSGTVLDPNGIPLSTAPNDQLYPAVAYNGTNYLVAWQDFRGDILQGPYGSTSYSDIYGTRVSGAGSVLDPSGIPISTAAYSSQLSPSVARAGSNFLVVWADQRNGASDIYGARVSGAGAVLEPSGIAISTATSEQFSPAVAHNGTNYLVVWQDFRSGTSYDIYGARVSNAGSVLNPSGIAISTATSSQDSPAVVRSGTNCLVIWEDSRSGNSETYGAQVSSTGAVLDPSGIRISTGSSSELFPAIASDGTNHLVVWQGYRSGVSLSDVYGARVSSTGSPLGTSRISISNAANGQYAPAVAHDGTSYLVVWQDLRGTSYDIYGARVSSTGTVLDPSGIAISTATYDQSVPAVAYNGRDFLVVWQDSRSGNSAGNIFGPNYNDIYGARVSSSGVVLDPSGIAISTATNGQHVPAVAPNGTGFLVVWHDLRNGSNSADIYGARVSGSGAVLDASGLPISTAAGNQYAPSVAHNGVDFLVAWEDFRSGSSSDVYGTRVSGSGVVLDTSGIPISTAINHQGAISVAYGGTNYLVVWQDLRNSTTGYDIYGARVSSSGTVLDASGLPISTAAGSQSAPAAVYDGANFLVVWEDTRGSSSSDIYGARVSGSGVLLDTSGFAISTDPSAERQPILTSMGGQSALVVYRGFRNSAATNSERVLARLIQSP